MKGHTVIELKDSVTGKIDRYEDDNMFTNALNAVFNRAPYWLNNTIPAAVTDDRINPFMPIIGNALGGLLLFPQTIQEDPSLIFADALNKPTGIASFDGYSGTDPRRGNFNEIESGPISNGYKFVWDFATSQANGQISCACLTSAKGGAGYLDSGDDFIKDTSYMYSGAGGGRSIDSTSYSSNILHYVGSDDTGLYFAQNSNTPLIYKLNTCLRKFTLLGDPRKLVTLGSLTREGIKLIVNGYLWVVVVSGNSSGNASIQIDKINLESWEKTTETFTVAAQLRSSNNSMFTCVVDDYLYLIGYDNKSVYKVNINNVADVHKYENALTAYPGGDSAGFIPFNGGVLTQNCYLEADGTSHTFNFNMIPARVDGPWLVNTNIGGGTPVVSATVITPYLATINNLDQVIQKNAQQTMKVTYTVYEE